MLDVFFFIGFLILGYRDIFKKDKVGNVVIQPSRRQKLWKFFSMLLILPGILLYHTKDKIDIDIIATVSSGLLLLCIYMDMKESIRNAKIVLEASDPELFKEYERKRKKNFYMALPVFGLMPILWFVFLIQDLMK